MRRLGHCIEHVAACLIAVVQCEPVRTLLRIVDSRVMAFFIVFACVNVFERQNLTTFFSLAIECAHVI